jgi:hypothetical protein
MDSSDDEYREAAGGDWTQRIWAACSSSWSACCYYCIPTRIARAATVTASVSLMTSQRPSLPSTTNVSRPGSSGVRDTSGSLSTNRAGSLKSRSPRDLRRHVSNWHSDCGAWCTCIGGVTCVSSCLNRVCHFMRWWGCLVETFHALQCHIVLHNSMPMLMQHVITCLLTC